MQTQAPITADAAQLALIQKKLQLDHRARSGLNWFYWIAGLSLLNSAAYLLGATFTFVIGLGVTQAVDGIVAALSAELGDTGGFLRIAGMGINIVIAGMFVLMGYFGRKRVRWPVIVGMVLYALDAILLLLVQDYLGVLFHALALYGIWTGLNAVQRLEALENAGGSEPIDSLRQRSAAFLQPQITPQSRRLRWILVGVIVFILVVPFIISALQR